MIWTTRTLKQNIALHFYWWKTHWMRHAEKTTAVFIDMDSVDSVGF